VCISVSESLAFCRAFRGDFLHKFTIADPSIFVFVESLHDLEELLAGGLVAVVSEESPEVVNISGSDLGPVKAVEGLHIAVTWVSGHSLSEGFSLYLGINGTFEGICQVGFRERVEQIDSVFIAWHSLSESFGVVDILRSHHHAEVRVGQKCRAVAVPFDQEFQVSRGPPHAQAFQPFLQVEGVHVGSASALENLVGILEVEVSPEHQLRPVVLGVHVCVQQSLDAARQVVLVGGAQLGDASVRRQLHAGFSDKRLVQFLVHRSALHEAGGQGAHGRLVGGRAHWGLDQGVILGGSGPDAFARRHVLAELGVLHPAVLRVVLTPHDGVDVELCEGVAVPPHEIGDGVPEDGSVAVDVYAIEQVEEVVVVAVGQLSLEGVEPSVLVQL